MYHCWDFGKSNRKLTTGNKREIKNCDDPMEVNESLFSESAFLQKDSETCFSGLGASIILDRPCTWILKFSEELAFFGSGGCKSEKLLDRGAGQSFFSRALSEILSNTMLLLKFRAASLKKSRDFEIQKVADQYQITFQDVMDRR